LENTKVPLVIWFELVFAVLDHFVRAGYLDGRIRAILPGKSTRTMQGTYRRLNRLLKAEKLIWRYTWMVRNIPEGPRRDLLRQPWQFRLENHLPSRQYFGEAFRILLGADSRFV